MAENTNWTLLSLIFYRKKLPIILHPSIWSPGWKGHLSICMSTWGRCSWLPSIWERGDSNTAIRWNRRMATIGSPMHDRLEYGGVWSHPNPRPNQHCMLGLMKMMMCKENLYIWQKAREPGRLGRLERQKDRVCKHAGLDSPVDRNKNNTSKGRIPNFFFFNYKC